jgi:hypothetical protein
LNDNYPSMIRGLVYVTGTLHAPADGKTSVSDGVLLAGSMLFESSHRVRFSPLFAASPPPGFAQGNPMVIAPGTWRRETTLPSGGGMSGETASLPPPGLECVAAGQRGCISATADVAKRVHQGQAAAFETAGPSL